LTTHHARSAHFHLDIELRGSDLSSRSPWK
jgi:hypothetical protein